MQIERHDQCYVVKLEDGSSWRIWPGDIALTWWRRPPVQRIVRL